MAVTHVANELDAARDALVAEFESFAASRGGESGPIAPIRRAAIDRFIEQGLPTTKHEDWRYTNLAPIARAGFRPGWALETPAVSATDIAPWLIDEAATTLVFVNGRLDESLSNLAAQQGVEVTTLARLIEESPEQAATLLGRWTGYDSQPTTALHAAMVEDGVIVRTRRSAVVEAPIHALFIAAAGSEPAMSQPRVMVVAEEASQVRIVEEHVAPGEGVVFANGLTELVARDGAFVDHYKAVHGRDGFFHVGAMEIEQGAKAVVHSNMPSWGGPLIRHNIHGVLSGEGGDCGLGGVSLLKGSEHVDVHLRMEHAAAHCTSREVFKHVLDDQSRGGFTGRILVHPGAQKTDAVQTNPNLVLSAGAQADTRPQLEIFADDVKCTHAATVGQIDEDAVFYLRSRGLSDADARGLMIRAFADEILEHIKIDSLKERLQASLYGRLAGVPTPAGETEATPA